MTQSTTCPNCYKRFAVRAQAVGRRAKCPKCAQPFIVELDREEDEPPTIDDLAAVAAMGSKAGHKAVTV